MHTYLQTTMLGPTCFFVVTNREDFARFYGRSEQLWEHELFFSDQTKVCFSQHHLFICLRSFLLTFHHYAALFAALFGRYRCVESPNQLSTIICYGYRLQLGLDLLCCWLLPSRLVSLLLFCQTAGKRI